MPVSLDTRRTIEKDIVRHCKKRETMDESPFLDISHPRQKAFLVAFLERGNVRRARYRDS